MAIISIQSYTKSKISNQDSYNLSHVIFQSNASATAWEVRATNEEQSPEQGVGILIDSGGSINSDTDVPFDVYGSQLSIVLGDLDDSDLGDLDDLYLGEMVTEDDTYAISIYVYSGGVWYG